MCATVLYCNGFICAHHSPQCDLWSTTAADAQEVDVTSSMLVAPLHARSTLTSTTIADGIRFIRLTVKLGVGTKFESSITRSF